MSRLFGWIRPALVRYCRTRINPRSGLGGADDVAQDICIAVLRGGRDKSDPTEDTLSRLDPGAGPEELAMRGEQRAMVRALLAILTPTQRQILTLRIVVGLSSAEPPPSPE